MQNNVRNVNKKALKKNKFKMFATGVVLAIGLTGCGITNTTTTMPIKTTSSVEQQQTTYYPIIITYNNLDTDVIGNEIITFTNHDGTIYNAIRPTNKGYTETNLVDNQGKIFSTYLNKSIDIPNTDTDHQVELSIDYKTKTMSINVVSLTKTK